MKNLALVLTAIVVPGLAVAHPGHGAGVDSGLVHYLTDPLHVGLVVLVLGAALLVRRVVRRQAA